MKRLFVTKFGGTSVSSRINWDHIVSITKKHIQAGKKPIIVCSALSQASNHLEKMTQAALLNQHEPLLEELHQKYIMLAKSLEVDDALIRSDIEQLRQWLRGIALLQEASPKIRAQIMSLGELMLTRIGGAFLKQQGLSVRWFDVRKALVVERLTQDDNVNYLSAKCEGNANPELATQFLDFDEDCVLTQGFIASNRQGETVLLGRGGSDTSAALLSAMISAEGCEIWTDVPGVYTSNPHHIPHARLLKQLTYEETQELASMGAKVLHPNCIPPVKKANIPLFVKATHSPEHPGTQVAHYVDEQAPSIKSIQVKHGVLLISIDTPSMWQQVGFLADVFQKFKQHGFSVDLLSSSESHLTLSLDSQVHLREKRALESLLADLNQFARAKVIESCSAVSLVGHKIRSVLPKLNTVLSLFEGQQIFLMSLASNDLNLTFVVHERQADKLCQELHAVLIENNSQSFYYSKSWQEEFGEPKTPAVAWWEDRREELLALAQHSPCYVYNLSVVAEKAQALLEMKAIDHLFYAIKANSNSAILRVLYEKGLGFECVSIYELEYVLQQFPDISRKKLLFTPNFASRLEYERALELGCHITLDNLYPLAAWGELFRDKQVIIRLDPGFGLGHHKYVCTGGNDSKFGIPFTELTSLNHLIETYRTKVVGLHIHSGSGILSHELWQQTALILSEHLNNFPDIEFLNLGGGLGIVEKSDHSPLDLELLDKGLLTIKSQHPHIQYWLEPGRFLVAESGIVLAKMTQSKRKGQTQFIGLEVGMNSLIRPALYGAYHDIINLSRMNEEKNMMAHIVGPICESGDVLGYHRILPNSYENDVFLITNTGAYGYTMGSQYNLRPIAQEVILS